MTRFGNSIVVHYKELALKGRNRPWFVRQLVRNLRRALAGLGVHDVRSVMGRIEIELSAPPAVSAGGNVSHADRDGDGSALLSPEWAEVRDRVQQVFGIANFSYAGRAPHDFTALART